MESRNWELSREVQGGRQTIAMLEQAVKMSERNEEDAVKRKQELENWRDEFMTVNLMSDTPQSFTPDMGESAESEKPKQSLLKLEIEIAGSRNYELEN
jgi:hypothetical protein